MDNLNFKTMIFLRFLVKSEIKKRESTNPLFNPNN